MDKPNELSSLEKKCLEIQFINGYQSKGIRGCGIKFEDLPGSSQAKLDRLTKLKSHTGVALLDEQFLTEWYTDRMERMLPESLALNKLKTSTMSNEAEIQQIEQMIQKTEDFMATIEQFAKSEEEMEKHLEEKASAIERLAEKRAIAIPTEAIGVDIEEIIDKITNLDSIK